MVRPLPSLRAPIRRLLHTEPLRPNPTHKLRGKRTAGRNFVDYTRTTVTGGRGGNGCVSFLREPFLPDGPPNGGDGGRGGSVFFEANENETSLCNVKHHISALAGAPGKGKNMHGSDAPSLTVRVPLGTVIRELAAPVDSSRDRNEPQTFLDELSEMARDHERSSKASLFVHYPRFEDRDNSLAHVRIPYEYRVQLRPRAIRLLAVDLAKHGDRVLVARGGAGGLGNPHFFSAHTRRPQFALRGIDGQRRTLEVELKTIADVGLVGLPNAGKSTFLRALTNAHPKVAAYAFTTLNPYIGTVRFRDEYALTVADIPGLVSGAHRNIGLGHEFLRHVERSRVIAYVVDASVDPLRDLEILRGELGMYKEGLDETPCVVIANKADLEGARERCAQLSSVADIVIPVSAKLEKNITKVAYTIRELLESL